MKSDVIKSVIPFVRIWLVYCFYVLVLRSHLVEQWGFDNSRQALAIHTYVNISRTLFRSMWDSMLGIILGI